MDCVILCCPKDEDIIQRVVNGVAANVADIRYIYVIAARKLPLTNCAVFEESLFPFTREQVAAATSDAKADMYLHQLIKFHASLLISTCSENVLVLDGDTIFYKRVKFVDVDRFQFDMVREAHPPYFEYMTRLHPSFIAWKPLTSGIVKYGIWNKKILIELMQKVEEHHKKDFWKAYLDCLGNGAASEYEIYWHYTMTNHSERVRLRPLRWSNFGQRWEKDPGDYQYVSYPWQRQRAEPPKRR